MLYLKYVEPKGMLNSPKYRSIRTQFGCVESDPDTATAHIRIFLQGVKELSTEDGRVRLSARIRPIRRIEIFGDDYTEITQHRLLDCGLVLFDDKNEPVLHVLNALLGYDGLGSTPTQTALRELSVPTQIFDEIQWDLQGIRSTNTPYYIVIQSTEREDGSVDWQWARVAPPRHIL